MPVIVSDSHAHAYPGSHVTEQGSNQRLLDVIASLDRAREYARSTKQSLVHCGDLFHDRKGVKPEVLHRVGEWLDRCRADGVAVYALSGNHDMSIHGDNTTSIRGLSGSTTVVDECAIYDIDGVSSGFCPYTDDPGLVRKVMKFFAKQKVQVVYAHLGLGDPQFAECVPSDFEVPGAINVSDLMPDHFEAVFLGHYHNYQNILSNVTYVGSPLQLSFKESGQRRGFVSWAPGAPHKFIENLVSPRFVKTVDPTLKGVKPGDHVWVVGLDRQEASEVSESLKGHLGVVRVDVARREEVAPRLPASAKGADLLRAYVKSVTEETPAEVEELVRVGSDIFAHASLTT